MLGATAAGAFPTVPHAMRGMAPRPGSVATVKPAPHVCRRAGVDDGVGAGAKAAPRDMCVPCFHDAKFRVFARMRKDQLAYRALMAD